MRFLHYDLSLINLLAISCTTANLFRIKITIDEFTKNDIKLLGFMHNIKKMDLIFEYCLLNYL